MRIYPPVFILYIIKSTILNVEHPKMKKRYTTPTLLATVIKPCHVIAASLSENSPEEGLDASTANEAGGGIWFESKPFSFYNNP